VFSDNRVIDRVTKKIRDKSQNSKCSLIPTVSE
jgi:hypothetical protein